MMICHTMSAQVGAIEKVFRAVKSGELSQEQVEASVQRVAALKEKYVSRETIPALTVEASDARNARQASTASEIYAKSTTLVRSVSRAIPVFPSGKRIVFVSPGKTPPGGGAVESGQEKTRAPYTPNSYIDILRAQYPGITEVRFLDGAKPSTEEDSQIENADIVILVTRNATQSPYQKDYGLALGKKLGSKLIVVATCDPYDFITENENIKNYITIYEPTIPAFKAAVDVIFGITVAKGSLPVGNPTTRHDIRVMNPFAEEDVKRLWNLWQEIFPGWSVEFHRMAKILQQPHGQHYLHDKGFCMSFLETGPHGKIAAVGVLPDYRNKGLGTAFVAKAHANLRKRAGEAEMGPLKSLAFGSVFPRLWCQPTIDLPQETKNFLLHRGLL